MLCDDPLFFVRATRKTIWFCKKLLSQLAFPTLSSRIEGAVEEGAERDTKGDAEEDAEGDAEKDAEGGNGEPLRGVLSGTLRVMLMGRLIYKQAPTLYIPSFSSISNSLIIKNDLILLLSWYYY